jgi:hypothetical protein
MLRLIYRRKQNNTVKLSLLNNTVNTLNTVKEKRGNSRKNATERTQPGENKPFWSAKHQYTHNQSIIKYTQFNRLCAIVSYNAVCVDNKILFKCS